MYTVHKYKIEKIRDKEYIKHYRRNNRKYKDTRIQYILLNVTQKDCNNNIEINDISKMNKLKNYPMDKVICNKKNDYLKDNEPNRHILLCINNIMFLKNEKSKSIFCFI